MYQGHKLHFKQKPGHPLMEYAIHNLTSRIAGKLTPAVELVRFDVDVSGKSVCHPVLVSQTIPGKTLREVLFEKNEVNLTQYTWQVLASILTRPGDGRLSNYVFDKNGMIYCVDNDVSFVEPVVKGWMSGRNVQFCSALFTFLSLTISLDKRVLEEFVRLEGSAILDAWIQDVITKEKEYTALFTEEERKRLYTENKDNSFTTTVLFREGTLATLNLQFWQLQNIIKNLFSENKIVTPGDLLKELISLREEAIGIYIYKTYLKAETMFVEERLQQITPKNIQTKCPKLKTLYLSGCSSITEISGPFYSSLLNFSLLENLEVNRCSSLKTVRVHAPNLKIVFAKRCINLKANTNETFKPKTLILSHSNLEKSDLESYLHQYLEYLDISDCTQLDNSIFQSIEIKCSKLRTLCISGCKKITGISGSFYSSLLEFPVLERIEINRCPDLKTLCLRAPNLEIVSAKHNPLLEEVKVNYRAKVDLTNSPKAKISFISNVSQTTLKGHIGPVSALTQLSDGTLVSGSWDKTIILWDMVTEQCTKTLRGHDTMVLSLKQLTHKTLVSVSSWEPGIKLWNIVTGKCKRTLGKRNFYDSDVTALTHLKDGSVVRCLGGSIIKLWDVKTGRSIMILEDCVEGVCALTQLSDGTLVSGSLDSIIKLWDVKTGQCIKTLKGHGNSVLALTQLSDGTLVSGSEDSTIKLWDVKTGQSATSHKAEVKAPLLDEFHPVSFPKKWAIK